MAPNKPRPTKAERREAARAQAKALREEQERLERRAKITRRSLLGVGVVAVAAGGAFLVVQSRNGSGTKVPTGVNADGSWTYGADLTVGSVNKGAPVLDVYFDYSCHFCADFETLHSGEIETLLKDGRITLAIHPCQILEQRWTDQVMNAMGVILDEQPDAALDFHNAILAFFTEIYQAQDASMMSKDNVVAKAQEVGVTAAVTDKIADAIDNNTYGQWIELGTKTFRDLGFSGTPTVLYDGQTLDLRAIATATGLTTYIDGLAPAGETAEPATGEAAEPATETPAG